ncbi:MAG: hypothetical protein EZS28_052303, partial [Streblomastix strix]
MYIKADDPDLPAFYFDPIINPIPLPKQLKSKKETNTNNVNNFFNTDNQYKKPLIEEIEDQSQNEGINKQNKKWSMLEEELKDDKEEGEEQDDESEEEKKKKRKRQLIEKKRRLKQIKEQKQYEQDLILFQELLQPHYIFPQLTPDGCEVDIVQKSLDSQNRLLKKREKEFRNNEDEQRIEI